MYYDPRRMTPYTHDWIVTLYEDALNRGNLIPLARALSDFTIMRFDGVAVGSVDAMLRAFSALAARLEGRGVRLRRLLVQDHVPVEPETFAHCAMVWWIAPGSGQAMHGASLIHFDENRMFLDMEELWSGGSQLYASRLEPSNWEIAMTSPNRS